MKTKARIRMGPPNPKNGNSGHRRRRRVLSGQTEAKTRRIVTPTPTPGPTIENPMQNETAQSSVVTPNNISRARRSLYQDLEKVAKEEAAAKRLSHASINSEILNDRVPPIPTSHWKDPAPPDDPQYLLPTSRRSQRLIRHEPSPDHAPVPSRVDSYQDFLAFDQISVHSDYGTASENSFTMRGVTGHRKRRNTSVPHSELAKKRKLNTSDIDGVESSQSQSQGYESGIDADDNPCDVDILIEDMENESRLHQRSLPWDSDDEQIIVEKKRKVEEWDCENADLAVEIQWVFHKRSGVQCIIPLEGFQFPADFNGEYPQVGSRLDKRTTRRTTNPSYKYTPFAIHTFSNFDVESTLRKQGLRVISASPIVSIEPRGTKFCQIYPSVVSIPLEVYPAEGDEVHCLYCLDSSEILSEDSKWCVHPDVKVYLDEVNGSPRVSFQTFELCYFTVVIREKGFMATKQIRSRIGGRLVVPDSMIEINFPKGSVSEDIIAKVRVHLDTELSLPDFFDESDRVCLASPILLLEPHGLDFMPACTIQLPIPDYDLIKERFGSQAQLSIWESRTTEDEIPKWELLDAKYSLSRVKQTTVISFKVTHFSFFRAVWDIISSSLYDAKVGVSYFYPYITFAMKCQANMEENSERNSFGLEVICYRSDKMLPMPELTNYVHRVGACSKPKLVRPGRIIVRLKSLFFEADVDAGEDPSLEKEEADFRGRDFEMQYACKFKPDVTIDRGTFGKVIVKRCVKSGKEEAIFEFNLQKSGHEGESTPFDRSDRWSIVALKELATNLFITDGDNWKVFAGRIGFTKVEIKRNLKNAPDPFVQMIQMFQQRSGTPDEFVKALYAVHRELKLSGGLSPCSTASVSSNSSSGRGSLPGKYAHGQSSDSDTSGTQISQDSLLNGSRKRSNPSINRSGGSGSNGKLKRRRIAKLTNSKESKQDADNESSTSGNRSSDTDSNRETTPPPGGSIRSDNTSLAQRNDLTKLGATFLWELSSSMDSLNWRALGRTLGVEEPALLNIEHSYKSTGFRECAYQMLLFWKEKYPKKSNYSTLYSALRKENMNAVAKKMKSITAND